MKAQTKSTLLLGIIAGVTFALVTAGLEYFEGKDFRIWKFIFNVLFFGTFMGLIVRYNLKKQAKKENKTD